MHTWLQLLFLSFLFHSKKQSLSVPLLPESGDALQLSSPSSRGGEMVFLRVCSQINSFLCCFCAVGAVEVSTLCLQASFRVSKTCLLGKLKVGISPCCLPCLCCPRKPFWIDLAMQVVVTSIPDCCDGGHSIWGSVKKPSVEDKRRKAACALDCIC